MFALVMLSLVSVSPASGLTIDVTSCPAHVPAGVTGVVQADLDCTGASGTGYVVLERGAALHLNGHSLTFNPGDPVSALVLCESNCRVMGPGVLTSSAPGFASVRVASGSVATFQNLAIQGMVHGIVGLGARVKVRETAISAQQWGIAGVTRAVLDGVTVAVTDPGGYCIGATFETGSVVVGKNVILASCVDGIWASYKVRLTGLVATNNSGIGVYSAGRLILKNSTVTGSDVLDLLSGARPVLLGSTCDRSGIDTDDVVTESWGVCAND